MKILNLFFLCIVSIYAQVTYSYQQETEILVRLPKDFVGTKVSDFIQDHFIHDYYSVGYISNSTWTSLDENIKSHIQILDSKIWAKGRYNIETLEILPELKDIGEYHNYPMLTAFLQKIAKENPEIVSLRSAGKSVQGRELWYVVLSDQPEVKEAEPVTALIANMHGDETAGREMLITLINTLVNSYKNGDRRIQDILNHSQVLIMPSMNPDGFELGRRGNANSVDLNRNFDDPIAGASRNLQVETKALMAFHQEHQPTLGLNFHGGTVCFNMPWDHKSNRQITFADDSFVKELAEEYASLNQTMYNNNEFEHGITYGYEWYQVLGGMQDWSILNADSIHATIELSHTKWPQTNKLPLIYAENEEALLRVLEKGLFGLHLEIVDQNGQGISNVKLRSSGSSRWITYKSPYIHRLVQNAQQEVEIAVGNQSTTMTIEPSSFTGNFLRIRLSR